MDENHWTIVQKKSTNQKLSWGSYGSHALETIAPSDDAHLLLGCETPHDVNQCKHEQQADQSDDISSLIGTPFIIPSHVMSESNNGNADSVNPQSRHLTESVRGILRICPGRGKKETVVVTSKKEVDDIDLGKIDWPTIPGSHRDGENATSNERDSTSWSTVLKTVPLPKHVEKVETSPRNGDQKESGKQSGKVLTEKKKKKEQGASSEKRRDQPLLLEFESLFESLQVQRSKKVFATGGAPPMLNKPSTKQETVQHKEASRSGNVLDSSAPATRRGKERETPKKKRPSALRKVISSEKEKKKATVADADVEAVVSVDVGTQSVRPTIHNRRFRDYCNHLVTEEINSCVESLLSDLVRFQDRVYLKDPIKAKAKRRYVCGLREVLKHVKLKRLKCVILPPNLDRIQSKGGINDVVHQIQDQCVEQHLPVIFAMSRRRLALVLKKRHKIGCVGIFSYDGAEVHYKQLMGLVDAATAEYEAKVSAVSTSTDPHKELEDSPKEDQVKTDIPSGSSCESSDSEVEASMNEEQDILSTPWNIFFEHSKSVGDQVEKPDYSTPLNVDASEFIPSFGKLNVDAKEFVPLL